MTHCKASIRVEVGDGTVGQRVTDPHGYFTDPPATFHPQLINALESDTERRLLIIGFRGSGKSTFGSLALPLWAALEHPEQYPFISLVADSSRQATLNISALKYELETNALIKQDYGEIKGNVIDTGIGAAVDAQPLPDLQISQGSSADNLSRLAFRLPTGDACTLVRPGAHKRAISPEQYRTTRNRRRII